MEEHSEIFLKVFDDKNSAFDDGNSALLIFRFGLNFQGVFG
jgi:hypothetical protein